MIGYNLVILKDMIDSIGEDRAKAILSDFICPQNKDIEDFLWNRAITFEKQGVSTTYLIFASHKGNIRLFGFFAITIKAMSVPTNRKLSENLKKRLNKFAVRNNDTKEYLVPSILIAQLGKNYKDNLNKEIMGDELLKIACDKAKQIQRLSSGKFIYLECEDEEKLISFYKRNGFHDFGKRERENYEKSLVKSKYLVQMLKYLK